jgi:hypothetical protein
MKSNLSTRGIIGVGAGIVGSMLALTGAARADYPVQTLHMATNDGNTYDPTPGLIVGSDGIFYGTTQGYRATNGAVFSLSANGATYATVYPFSAEQKLVSGVVEGPDGSLYGTIEEGMAPITKGAVFKVTKTGVYTTLHTFTGTDGANPWGPLVFAADGTIYGTTFNGGAGVGT